MSLAFVEALRDELSEPLGHFEQAPTVASGRMVHRTVDRVVEEVLARLKVRVQEFENVLAELGLNSALSSLVHAARSAERSLVLDRRLLDLKRQCDVALSANLTERRRLLPATTKRVSSLVSLVREHVATLSAHAEALREGTSALESVRSAPERLLQRYAETLANTPALGRQIVLVALKYEDRDRARRECLGRLAEARLDAQSAAIERLAGDCEATPLLAARLARRREALAGVDELGASDKSSLLLELHTRISDDQRAIDSACLDVLGDFAKRACKPGWSYARRQAPDPVPEEFRKALRALSRKPSVITLPTPVRTNAGRTRKSGFLTPRRLGVLWVTVFQESES